MTRMMIIVVAGLGLAAAAPAMAANQFDLKCSGTQELKTGAAKTAWRETFRFDLDAKRWCRGACKTAAAIDSVTADEITVMDSRVLIGGPPETTLSVSRTTGQAREYIDSGWAGGSFDIAKGTCTKDLYSGMPGTKF